MLPAVRTAPALVRHCARPLSTRLTTALDGTPADSPTHIGSGDVHATTLENGLRVVSVETYSPSSVVGLVVKAGARYEDGLPYGTAHTLSRLAYKSTSRTTSFRRTVDIENQCESFAAAAGREQLRFVGTLPRANVADFVSTSLFDSLSLTAHEYEVLEVEQTIREDAHQTVRSRLLNALYREAYDDRAIGRPVVPCGAWPLPDNEDVRIFIERTHHASRTALVGVGVDHQQLVDLAREAFTATSQPDQPAAAAAATVSSDYTGGRIRVPAPGVPSFVAVAFNGKGVSGAHLLAISKLFNVNDKIEGFCDAWSDAALTGLIVNNADQQLAVERIRSLKNASNDALKNAITAARAQTAWQLGTRKGTWEVLAGHAFLNHQLSTKALLESLEQLTPEQLRQSVASVLASPPTIASIGRSDNIIRSV